MRMMFRQWRRRPLHRRRWIALLSECCAEAVTHDIEFVRSCHDLLSQIRHAGLSIRIDVKHSLALIVDTCSAFPACVIFHFRFGECSTLADAILDRLVNNAHRLQLTGDSMR